MPQEIVPEEDNAVQVINPVFNVPDDWTLRIVPAALIADDALPVEFNVIVEDPVAEPNNVVDTAAAVPEEILPHVNE